MQFNGQTHVIWPYIQGSGFNFLLSATCLTGKYLVKTLSSGLRNLGKRGDREKVVNQTRVTKIREQSNESEKRKVTGKGCNKKRRGKWNGESKGNGNRMVIEKWK